MSDIIWLNGYRAGCADTATEVLGVLAPVVPDDIAPDPEAIAAYIKELQELIRELMQNAVALDPPFAERRRKKVPGGYSNTLPMVFFERPAGVGFDYGYSKLSDMQYVRLLQIMDETTS